MTTGKQTNIYDDPDEWEDITPMYEDLFQGIKARQGDPPYTLPVMVEPEPEPEPELEASGFIRSLMHIDYFITQAVFIDHQGDIKSLCFRCDIDPGPSLLSYFLN